MDIKIEYGNTTDFLGNLPQIANLNQVGKYELRNFMSSLNKSDPKMIIQSPFKH